MNDVSLIVYSVADMTAAKRFFGALIGAEPYADSPGYVGYKSGATEIGLAPGGEQNGSGGLAYWTVDDIAASVQTLVESGGTVVQKITDVAYGLLVASVREPNGSLVGLRQPPQR